MKGCTLAEQHKRKVTDLLKASVWHLLSAGSRQAREKVKVAEDKVMPY